MSRLLRLVLMTVLLCPPQAFAQFDYRLTPRQLAPDVYVLDGAMEDFSPRNGGNIGNASFVVTDVGVVIIDAGPSRRYGEQMASAIKTITAKPVTHILITHAHPDHYLGAQAFRDVGVYAVPATIQTLRAIGSAYLDNMYRLLLEWMKGSEPVVPEQAVNTPMLETGKRRLQLISLTGHTPGDLAIFDGRSGVLFAGDLVFFGRTPTTPHANISDWLASLDTLEKIPYKIIVPGHGMPHRGNDGIKQTRAYLRWLDSYLNSAANRGADMSELLATDPPPEFAKLAVFRDEFARTLAHLYPRYEQASMK